VLSAEAAEAAAQCEATIAVAAWAEALSACERARMHDGTSATTAELLAQVYLVHGRAALSEGDVAGALPWFERARMQRPTAAEPNREYALALAYRAGEAAMAQGNWEEAVAKFEAVSQADPLYLSWLPDRAARQQVAAAEAAWGRQLLAERALDDALAHCLQAQKVVPDHSAAGECLVAITAARTPTATPTRTPFPVQQPGRPPVQQPARPPVQQPVAPARPPVQQPTARPSPAPQPPPQQPQSGPARPPAQQPPAAPAPAQPSAPRDGQAPNVLPPR
jgi:tetratricopeptide (TPR) repeat protein